MTTERACLACEGTGEFEAARVAPIPDEPTRGHHWRCGTCGSQNSDLDGTCQFCECMGTACTRWNCDDPQHFPSCPVCLGSGRVVDAITAQDAIADAETLRNMRLPAMLKDDGLWDTVLSRQWEHVRWYVLTAARAAFRAVPGLRGE